MTQAAPMVRPQWARFGFPMLFALGLVRFALTVYSGLTTNVGDFYQTLPGAYVRTLNPTLWNSPDLAGSAGFQRDVYLYGPTQYVTLFPLAYLNSYGQIAMWLLALYALVIAATIVVLWKTMAANERGRTPGVVPAACAALWFTPLLHAYAQREFEIAAMLIWAAGAYCLVRKREGLGGAAFGYVAWFKLLPLGFLPFLVLRRWFKATIAFVAVSAVLLGLTSALFGLDKFLMFSAQRIGQESAAEHIVGAQLRPLVGGRAGFYLDPRKSPGYIGTGFCDDWNETNETIVSVRWGLCGLNLRHAWLPSRELFYLFLLAAGGCFLTAFVKHERRTAEPIEDKWRTIWELSIVLMVTIVVVRAHYYYLVSLIFPIVALLYRYLLYGAGRIRGALLTASYVILAAFVVPVSILDRIVGRSVWHVYMQHDLYLYGELMLFVLLFWEYWPRARAASGPVRVLRVITRLNIGGPSIQATRLSGALNAHGFDTLLIHGRLGEGEGDMSYLLPAGQRTQYLDTLCRPIAPWSDLRAAMALYQAMRAFRPHLLHTHMAKAGLLARTAAAIFNVTHPSHRMRVIHTYHGHVLDGYFAGWTTRLFIALERGLAHVTDMLLGVSTRVRDDLLLRYCIGTAERFTVLPLGLDLDPFAAVDASSRAEARSALNITPGMRVVATVGRLTAIKHHSLFLDMAQRIAADTPDVAFLVAGGGELEDQLQAEARARGLADRVRFLGWRKDLATIYGASDLFVLTSLNEGTPVALIEAMASGVPGVATDVGGVRDVIVDDRLGLIVPPNEPNALTHAVRRLLADGDARIRMGAAARDAVLARFRFERLVEDVAALYRDLLSR